MRTKPPQIDKLIFSRRKTLALEITENAALIVRAPLSTSRTAVYHFVKHHEFWIARKQERVRRSKSFIPVTYREGGSIPYLGGVFPLVLVDEQKEPLILSSGFRLSRKWEGRAAAAFHQWYRERAREILTARVRFFAEKGGYHYRRISINSARTRWGSCGPAGTLNYSWRVVTLPMPVIDYIAVHELAHLKVRNHSDRFWREVERVMPDFRERKTRLKNLRQ